MDLLTTFPRNREFEKVRKLLKDLSLPYQTIDPGNRFGRVGIPAIVLSEESRMELFAKTSADFVFSGWVKYREPEIKILLDEPPHFDGDIFGSAAIVVLAPCIADRTKLRLVSHITGDLSEVFPYLNAEIENAIYNPNAPYFTFQEDYRRISLFPSRIGMAKADDIVDAWRVLEMIRCRVNNVWIRRGEIEPSFAVRKRPTTLDIFKHLPGTNCGECGQPTCLAFAAQLFTNSSEITQCWPVFEGDFSHLQHGLLEICAAL